MRWPLLGATGPMWGSNLEMITSLVRGNKLEHSASPDGQTMHEMTLAWSHNAQAEHSTPETTPEMTPDTQRPWVPLRRASQ